MALPVRPQLVDVEWNSEAGGRGFSDAMQSPSSNIRDMRLPVGIFLVDARPRSVVFGTHRPVRPKWAPGVMSLAQAENVSAADGVTLVIRFSKQWLTGSTGSFASSDPEILVCWKTK
ncbi:hypothetical protein G3O06_26370 [Burkholderia sp. Ac-20345]|uniref:hypothetical protein n=1 Tax=Burkholderia sp. Ac-20345 TaxID=2703891 RepID=UPI00197B9BF1|nr:hypothetical protein [Burkholderia sp. Ac-20345]MBN3781040.1 hypothetical protein [Burkholderia sp. Ac-20345]